MALNQLQYMSLAMNVIKFDDIKRRLLSSSKDEDISPFTAVDKYKQFTYATIASFSAQYIDDRLL